MSNVHKSGSRTIDGRFVKGHPGGPGRPRTAALDERAVSAGHSLEVAVELGATRAVTTVKLRFDRGK